MNDDYDLDKFFKNYQDRGMVKWAGFYLSDQTLKIEKVTKERNTFLEAREEQSIEDFTQIFFQAYSNSQSVNVQVRERTLDGERIAEYVGSVNGYYEDEVIVENHVIHFDEIINVQII